MSIRAGLWNWVALLRPVQWYKNLLLFLAPLFAGELAWNTPWLSLLAGFACFCAVSSANYIANDVLDRAADREHPAKKNRPVASGRIKPEHAGVLGALLLAGGAHAAFRIDPLFGASALLLFVVSFAYSNRLKHHRYWDVSAIAAGFVIRASAGTFIIHAPLSPWLVGCVFLLALFLALAKRKSEQTQLSADAGRHRRTLVRYRHDELDALLKLAGGAIVIAYIAFTQLAGHSPRLVVSAAFVTLGLVRYYRLMHDGRFVPMSPEKMARDPISLFALAGWFISVFVVLYPV